MMVWRDHASPVLVDKLDGSHSSFSHEFAGKRRYESIAFPSSLEEQNRRSTRVAILFSYMPTTFIVPFLRTLFVRSIAWN